MTRYVALLRAVNVGKTGKLPMADLKAICEQAGFRRVQTYIASGNVVFDSDAAPARLAAELGARLHAYAGQPVGVVIRSAAEMQAILLANPFPDAAPSRTVAIFLDEPPSPDALASAIGLRDEVMQLGKREIFVHYASGIGRSKLKIPMASTGTARNMNTVSKLTAMALTH
ncbi:MAG TPA: DUF1697 domain-containing protein [Rhodopila sp.]|jgi:uncharacterized protein (DUF1697 family)